MSDSEQIQEVSFALQNLEGVGGGIEKKLIELGYYDITTLVMASSAEVATKLNKPQHFAEDLIIKANNYIRENKVLEREIITSTEYANIERTRERLTTGSKNLDKLLGGGIETKSVTEFVAEAAHGKSQLCFQLAVMATLPKEKGGLNGNVLYIDTEQTYSAQRVEQIITERKLDPSITDKIYLRRPQASVFLELFVQDIFRIIKEYNIKLVIIDSISNLHRQEFLGREHLADRQHKFSKMISTLVRAASLGVAVVISNQVLQNPNGATYGNPNIAVGGSVIGHGTTHRIFLSKKQGGSLAKVIDSPRLPPEEATFKITPKGIEDYNPKTKTVGTPESEDGEE
jgi:DNA repair protein RadA